MLRETGVLHTFSKREGDIDYILLLKPGLVSKPLHRSRKELQKVHRNRILKMNLFGAEKNLKTIFFIMWAFLELFQEI